MRKKITLALLSLLLVPLGMMAQNVTVHPGNGSMLPAVKQGGKTDTFYDWNGFATWKHNQLALTMTTGDSDNNTSGADANGQLEKPANDIFATEKNEENPDAPRYLQIGAGKGLDTYIVFSLPRGYRFTGYTIQFHRIAYPTPENTTINTSGTVTVNGDDVLNSSSSIAFGETTANFSFTNVNKTFQNNIGSNNTTKYTLTRTSGNDTDMGNLLYFRLQSGASGKRAYIQLDHVELNFTAENNYAPILPTPNVNGQSAVNIPFITNKMDYGDLSPRDKSGNPLSLNNGGRISYVGSLHDLNANLILYEKGSTKSVTDNGFDGIGGDMVDFKDGSISSEGNYFKLDAEEHGDLVTTEDGKKEAIYFIEAPIWATNSSAENGHKEPVGYRITGASFDLKGSDEATPATFRIQHIGSDGNTYGLNSYEGTRLQYSQTLSYQTVWSIDEEGYIYYGTGNSKRYLALYHNEYYQYIGGREYEFQVTSTKPSADANTFVIVDNGGIKQIRFKNYENYYIGFYEYRDWYNQTQSRAYLTTGEDDRAFYTEISAANDGIIEPYTFIIYDKTGTTRYVYPVNGQDRTVSINGLNNDAVKIGVIGTGYVSGRITMQALDPYIDRLNIVCQENGDQEVAGGKVTQQFNATDFSVKGGAFTFYVPEDFKGNAKFTFENLYSKYGDETYYEETSSTNHARYYFMGSEYSGYEGNDVYARYNNTTYRNASYLKKIDCDIPGNVSFTFNNAAAVMSGQATTYEENPFSLVKYTAAGGNFTTEFIYYANEMDQTPEIVKTAYLFTCDEPRYNIAPTTATQHVAYAYYQMDIDMKKHTYAPILTWEKLYDNTFYSANNTDIVRDSQWGLKLTTDPVTDDQGTHSGYMTVAQLENAISNAQGIVQNIGKTVTDENRKFDIDEDDDIDKDDLTAAGSSVEGGEDLLPPTKSDQILYIDGSNLMSIMENQTASTSGTTTTYTTHSLSDLQETLGKNALIYLPFGSRPSSNNMAVNTISQYGEEYDPIFQSANNIKIEDRYPFYAPYDIQVPGANYALYDRTVTNPTLLGDDDQHLTIVLPFEIDVDAYGVHTNKDNQGTPFMLATMNSSNSLAKKSQAHIDYGTDAYFTKISGDHSEANKPYVVTLQSQTAGESAFKVHVKGALVKATPADKTGILTGEGPCTGTYTYEEDGVEQTDSYSFTHKGTYTGIEIGDEANGGAAAASTKVFYFSNNYFLDSKTLINNKSLKMLPFRSYYEYAGGAKAKMMKFRVVFGENDDDDTTGIGISEVQRNSTLAIIPGDGYITIMAKADSNVAIHTTNGMTVEKCNLRAGETRTVAMPSGIYVINGVKIIVK